MQTSKPTPPWKNRPNVGAVRDELVQLLDKGARDEALALVVSMLTDVLEKNNTLAFRLHAALKLLGRKKSERLSREQLALFLTKLTEEEEKLVAGAQVASADKTETPSETAAETPAETPASPPLKAKQPHKKPFPDHLRREVVNVPVPEGQRGCAECGGAKSPMGDASRTTWEFRPAEFYILEEKLETVVCKACESGIVTAEGTAKPIDGGRPGPGLLAQIVVSKTDDSSPLYRQATQIYTRSGIQLAPSTLGDWFAAAADIVAPVAAAARSVALAECHLLSLDDTWISVLDRAHPKGVKKGRIWTYIGDQDRIAFCEFTPNWEGEAPCAVLADFKGRVVQGDGYAGIDDAFLKPNAPRRAGCMDHGRRYFVTALDAGEPRAAIALWHIGKLYSVEADAKRDGASREELARRREKLSRPVALDLKRAVAKLHDLALPKSPLGRATTYAIRQWETLIAFLDDPRVPISNAHVERQQRKTGLGRKNYLFAGSDKGAQRLAILTTLITNCKLHGVSTFDYFRDVIAKLSAGWPQRRIRELLPGEWCRLRAQQPAQDKDAQ
jgi:transposase